MDHSAEIVLEDVRMEVEQAVFTSTRSRKSQGYHVVAASPGVDENISRKLALWGPSHAALLSDTADAESFNFHSLNDELYAVSRTVHGGPEYSRRGGLEVFTHFLLVQTEQLQGYGNDPLHFALTAQALGYLRFQPCVDDKLPTVELPDHSLVKTPRLNGNASVPLPEIMRILGQHSRVAVLGASDPIAVLSLILQQLPVDERLSLSFSTGLRPSLDRSFRLHFAGQPDSSLKTLLASHGIDYVTAV
jgi:hypothetical protein